METSIAPQPVHAGNLFLDHKYTNGIKNPVGNIDVYEVIYKRNVPPFLQEALEKLYENVYCTLARLRAYDSMKDVNTYVRMDGSFIKAIILFKVKRRTIYVLNQQISLTDEDLVLFSNKVYALYKRASVIRFYALRVSELKLSLPYQQLPELEENIITFPSSKEDYLQSLRGQFRKTLRTSEERLRSAHPSFKIDFFERDGIELNVVREILTLADKRMIAKGGKSYTRSVNLNALMKTVKEYGHVAVASIEGKVCAGSLWFRVGKRHFHTIAAHDPEYDQYILGSQIWMAAILHSHDLSGKECWLMGGAREHKAKFRARTEIFTSIAIYRSKLHILMNMPTYVVLWLRKNARAIKESSGADTKGTRAKAISRLLMLRFLGDESPQGKSRK